ncbi:MAG: hypothetical protein UU14_C0031G0007 [Candidatus Roizmanbacteria bacterium GW2011_GWB1_40_7]|uniref:Uncharacterized protein n=1 Tax=Candidatus Roizmanbacteria bacterium GW2011_GWB1_40_7 TaxID=1618482 RepID=A0A0G0VGX9_9BACT|nr:MAG: hypothetical protein US43_C0018G0017 [Candidatus Levybacteria bacterium GW2011_GWA1_37_16]KKR71295.1 MAG: hypothetical protein UU14_C0031G0007 [Candidatus Roizmanbacteria bacterium GW2011_GWB1_40_7]OGH51186.1 MAG: hypothetical protein A3H17_03000 [Candidatus Levybacteria bacterium RIFCSPLOWO2_12_FULL_37_14]
MRQISFTITEDEIRNVSKDISERDLSDEQIQSVLATIECDEMLWEDIRNSIIGSIDRELFP